MIAEKISQKEYEYLQKYGFNLSHFAHIFERNSEYYIEFEDYDDFSTYLTFDIIHYGMDNQDVVNDIGRELYAIHDRIYYE